MTEEIVVPTPAGLVNEFADMMPHLVKVTSSGGGYDDYGNPIEGTNERTYKCLIDDTTSTVRSADGEQITVALTAYVWPVPVESEDGLPVDIESTDDVEILQPRPDEHPNLTSVERHYYSDDGVGFLHNIVLRFT